MMDFMLWFMGELPDFLLAEPICYFVGLAITLCVARLTFSLMRVGR